MMKISRLAAPTHFLFLSLLGATSAAAAQPRELEVDRATYEQARAIVLNEKADSKARTRAMDNLVYSNARLGKEDIASGLTSTDPVVSAAAAQWLAVLRDPRGLDVQAQCLKTGECPLRHRAALLLAAPADPKYRPALLDTIRREVLAAQDGQADSSERQALRVDAALALARLGDPSDERVIMGALRTVRTDPYALEAAGYLRGSSEAAAFLTERLRDADRTKDDMNVARALLSLSRLGDASATDRVKEILSQSDPPSSMSLQAEVLHALKPRDVSTYALSVFEVMRREPESERTRDAWIAMGLMHPKGWGDRVLRLAMTKKPHWKTVSRQLLHDVVMALEPSLNDAFWKECGVDPIPTHSGQRTLVELGLGYLMFPGTMNWTGD